MPAQYPRLRLLLLLLRFNLSYSYPDVNHETDWERFMSPRLDAFKKLSQKVLQTRFAGNECTVALRRLQTEHHNAEAECQALDPRSNLVSIHNGFENSEIAGKFSNLSAMPFRSWWIEYWLGLDRLVHV